MSKNVLEQETSDPTELVGPDFMSGGGEMGALMRAHDWSVLVPWTALKLVSIASDGRAADA